MKKNFIKELDGQGLTTAELAELARGPGKQISISSQSRKRVQAARKEVEEILRSGTKVYGINTGFGRFAEVEINQDEVEDLQENLVISHAAGVGPEFSPEEVRAIFLLRVQGLLQGHSGVRESLVEFLVKAFNGGLLPVIPQQGSCGASGDLAPLAHLALVFIGRGHSRLWNGKQYSEVLPGNSALRKLKLNPLRLQAKEGLALINGTQVMTALGALACQRLATLVRSADVIGAMTLEGLKGSKTPFMSCLHELRPHPGQKAVAENLIRILEDSEILGSHKDCGKVQDAYSLRCMPQVHGATRDALEFCTQVIDREINRVTDNPLVFPKNSAKERILSGGNFHGQPVAQALDFLAFSCADLASISERRIERLLNPDLSELPAFLAYKGGLHSGFMMAQVTAASLVSEAKTLAHPASVDSIPTSANQEDHVSMGTTSARKLREIVKNFEYVLAIELLCAAKALEYHRPLRSSTVIEGVYRRLRKEVKTLQKDRELAPDIECARSLIVSGIVT